MENGIQASQADIRLIYKVLSDSLRSRPAIGLCVALDDWQGEWIMPVPFSISSIKARGKL